MASRVGDGFTFATVRSTHVSVLVCAIVLLVPTMASVPMTPLIPAGVIPALAFRSVDILKLRTNAGHMDGLLCRWMIIRLKLPSRGHTVPHGLRAAFSLIEAAGIYASGATFFPFSDLRRCRRCARTDPMPSIRETEGGRPRPLTAKRVAGSSIGKKLWQKIKS
jgi:hypothetical protein